MHERNYWIGVVSKDHVAIGVNGGFMQLNHGKAGPLERMRAGDGFAYYSPRLSYPDGTPLQAFTALGRIRDGTVFQAGSGDRGDMGLMPDPAAIRPFRLAVDYLPAEDAPIRPLIEALSFIRSKAHWGAAFRFGYLRVPEADFAQIAAAMGRDFAADFPVSRSAAEKTPDGQPISANST
jgi:hypothetical protein